MPNTSQSYRRSNLFISAIESNDLKTLQELIEIKAPLQLDKKKYDIAETALRHGNPDIIALVFYYACKSKDEDDKAIVNDFIHNPLTTQIMSYWIIEKYELQDEALSTKISIFHSSGLTDYDIVFKYALANQQDQLLQLLFNKSIKPSAEVIDLVFDYAANNNESLTKTMLSMRLRPSIKISDILFINALKKGDEEMLSCLFHCGAPLTKKNGSNIKDDDIFTNTNNGEILNLLLELAIENNRLALASILLMHGIKIDFIYDIPVLSAAVLKKNMGMLSILLKSGVDPNITSSSGEHPLFTALEEKNREALGLLIDHGGDVNYINVSSTLSNRIYYNSILHAAAHQGLEYVQNLLSITDKITPEKWLLKNKKNESPISILISQGTSIDELKLIGDTLPHEIQAEFFLNLYLLEDNRDSFIEILSKHPQLVDCRSQNGETLLMQAVQNNATDIAYHLLQEGSSIYTLARFVTPLSAAFNRNNDEDNTICRMLLDEMQRQSKKPSIAFEIENIGLQEKGFVESKYTKQQTVKPHKNLEKTIKTITFDNYAYRRNSQEVIGKLLGHYQSLQGEYGSSERKHRFEGSYRFEMIVYRLGDLCLLLDQLQRGLVEAPAGVSASDLSKNLSKEIKALYFAQLESLQIYALGEAIDNKHPLLDTLVEHNHDQMLCRLEALEHGDTYIIPCGYKKHCVQLCIDRIEDEYRIRIENLGDLALNHQPTRDKAKPFYIGSYPLDEFKSGILKSWIIEVKKVSITGDRDSANKVLYKDAETLRNTINNRSTDIAVALQVTGNCAHASLESACLHMAQDTFGIKGAKIIHQWKVEQLNKLLVAPLPHIKPTRLECTTTHAKPTFESTSRASQSRDTFFSYPVSPVDHSIQSSETLKNPEDTTQSWLIN